MAILIDADGSHHHFVGRTRSGFHRILSVDKSFEVRFEYMVSLVISNVSWTLNIVVIGRRIECHVTS